MIASYRCIEHSPVVVVSNEQELKFVADIGHVILLITLELLDKEKLEEMKSAAETKNSC